MVTAVINSLSACGAFKTWCVWFCVVISYPSVTSGVGTVGGVGETRGRGHQSLHLLQKQVCTSWYVKKCMFIEANEKHCVLLKELHSIVKNVYLFNRNIPTATHYTMGLTRTDCRVCCTACSQTWAHQTVQPISILSRLNSRALGKRSNWHWQIQDPIYQAGLTTWVFRAPNANLSTA